MNQTHYIHSDYHSPPEPVSRFSKSFPSIVFYRYFFPIVWHASRSAQRGQYDGAAWIQSSMDVLQALEQAGVVFDITGMDQLSGLNTPCVIIGNHMSVLETAILPGIIHPRRRVTFIVKQSLLDYPIFGPVIRARDPIAVTRTNPRQDLKTVMEQGTDRLNRGVSIIVFPQTTRVQVFDPGQFNTIGIKLAQRAGVPVIPLAVLTDAWKEGSLLSDIGPIIPSKPVHIAFGKPIWIQGRGTDAHQEVIQFIHQNLMKWQQAI